MSELDKILVQELKDLPPSDEMVNSINPSQKAFQYIAWGYALSVVTLPWGYLDLIFPLVSSMLLYLGVRILRSENRWFWISWAMTGLHLICTPITLGASAFPGDQNLVGLSHLLTALSMLQLICFWLGTAQFEREQFRPVRFGPAGALMILQILTASIALFMPQAAHSLILIFVLLTCYGAVLFALYRLGEEWRTKGYAFTAAKIHFRAPWLAIGYGILSVIIITGCCIYNYRADMDFQPVEEASAAAAAAKIHLSELRVPEEVLTLLSDEDVIALKDTESIAIERETQPRDSDISATEAIFFRQPNGKEIMVFYYQYDGWRPPISAQKWFNFELWQFTWESTSVDITGLTPPHGRIACTTKRGDLYCDVTETETPVYVNNMQTFDFIQGGRGLDGGQIRISYPCFSGNWRGYIMLSYDAPPNLHFTEINVEHYSQYNLWAVPARRLFSECTVRDLFNFRCCEEESV